jgi:hypothetical protein
MNNNQESNFFIPILSAIAGIGAIVTVLSPLALQNNTVAKLFILPDIIPVVTVIAIILSIIIIWYSSANHPNYDSIWAKISMYQWNILVIIIATLFYALKIMSMNNILNKDLAGILQIILYLSGYYVLSLILGTLLRSSYGSFRYKKIEVERYDRIQETLSKAGLIDTQIVIFGETFSQKDLGHTGFGAVDVKLNIKGVPYIITFSADYSKIFHTETDNNQ